MSQCFVCFENVLSSVDNRVLTSRECGHKVCRKCLQKQRPSDGRRNPLVNESAPPHGVDPSVACPICFAVPSAAEDGWLDREAEDTFFEQERRVRARVSRIYNAIRQHFDTTPQYNDYIERREAAVYTLALGSDTAEKRRIQEELEAYEAEQQRAILERQQEAMQREADLIREIVAKEGVFYEIVQKPYPPSREQASRLSHPLERRYPELFENPSGSSQMSSHMETATKSSTGSTLRIGGGGHPRPLAAADQLSNEIPKSDAAADPAAMLRACGLSKAMTLKRMGEELWGGLYVNLDTIPLG